MITHYGKISVEVVDPLRAKENLSAERGKDVDSVGFQAAYFLGESGSLPLSTRAFSGHHDR